MSKANNFFGILLTIIDYLNPFAGLHELYLVIKYYIIVNKVLRSNEGKKSLNEYNKKPEIPDLRIDNIGRLYTVINIPEEIRNKEDGIMLVTLNTLREINKILIPLGITDILIPNYYREYDKANDAYYILLIVSPNTSFFNWKNIVWELIKITTFIILITKIIWTVV